MSSNNLIYDTCEYQTRLNENGNQLKYILNGDRYYNNNKCRMELGVVAGTSVSNIKGNLVDLEGDLFGITRKASLCPKNKFSSNCANNMTNCKPGNISFVNTDGNTRTIDTNKVHLPSCNLVRHKPIPNSPLNAYAPPNLNSRCN